MQARSNVSPVPLSLQSREQGVALKYLDGRLVEYRGPIEQSTGSVTASLTYEIHVLVTDPTSSEGRMVYVNDYDTSDAVLESTGVGRVLLDEDEAVSLYPGVQATRTDEQITIDTEADAIAGAVYTFIENQLDERAYQLV